MSRTLRVAATLALVLALGACHANPPAAGAPAGANPRFDIYTPVTLTAEIIRKFAEGIGDPHPLYMDEDYARGTPFGGIIAPPSIHIMLMFACTDEKDWMRSPGTINASQSWFYNVPARPGDTILMVGKCLDRYIKKGRLFAIHENVFYNQKDEVVCSGRGWTIRPE